MKKSARARRMDRHHRRHRGAATLSLTSLMDIFTILVFFLLVNASNSQQLPHNKDIVLPESTAEQLPKDMLTIQISARDIIVQGQKVASVADVMSSGQDVVPALVKELQFRASRTVPSLDKNGNKEREVMILGDRQIPYKLLQRVMLSCTQTEYTKISFAVLKKAEEKK